MWKEILVDDIEGLEKCSEVITQGVCGTTFICSVSWIQVKLRWLTDATCYLYEDDEMRICAFNSYDSEIDRVITKFFYVEYLKVPNNPNKIHELSAENCKDVLERYGKKIRFRKYEDWHYRDKIGKTLNQTTNCTIEIFKKYGIKVTDSEKYLEYELM